MVLYEKYIWKSSNPKSEVEYTSAIV